MPSQVEQFYEEIPPHQFTVDGVTYEWMGETYSQRVNTLYEGASFGEDALLSKTVRNATIKADEDETHFATLSEDKYNICLKKIQEEKITKLIEYL